MNRAKMSPPLDSRQAELALRLWQTKEFDTAEIAFMVRADGEDAVCRLLQDARDVMRMMRAQG